MMRSTAVLLAALSVAAAGQASAAASDHLTDVDWLKANRCRGLAEGFGVTSTGDLSAFIKSEGRTRPETIYAKGQTEVERGKRDAAKTDGRDRFQAELNGYCTAFLGARTTASAH